MACWALISSRFGIGLDIYMEHNSRRIYEVQWHWKESELKKKRWDHVVIIIYIYTIDKLGSFLRNDGLLWVQGQQQRQLPRTQPETQEASILFPVKKGLERRCLGGVQVTQKICPPNPIYCFLLYLAPIKVLLVIAEANPGYSFESWHPIEKPFSLIV